MGADPAWDADFGLDLGSADSGLGVLLEACERAVEEISSTVPAAQLRALLVIDRAGSLNLNQFAKLLGTSASAASRLCDRMQLAGLLTRDRAAASRREILLLPTEAGRRLADWVRQQRRAAVAGLLSEMTADGAQALVRGLAELGLSVTRPTQQRPIPA
jgi:DNA-binding MarR family transcriptional regulator